MEYLCCKAPTLLMNALKHTIHCLPFLSSSASANVGSSVPGEVKVKSPPNLSLVLLWR